MDMNAWLEKRNYEEALCIIQVASNQLQLSLKYDCSIANTKKLFEGMFKVNAIGFYLTQQMKKTTIPCAKVKRWHNIC